MHFAKDNNLKALKLVYLNFFPSLLKILMYFLAKNKAVTDNHFKYFFRRNT